MATELEESQVKEFLKRAEIRTMKKDLRDLREVDALKERNKIATIKTLEEQRLEQEKNLREKEDAAAALERIKKEKILSENATQERLAEKDLKQYATEQERQQIFLFESQRLAFEKKVEEINNKKDPALKLEKNQVILQKNGSQEKLKNIEAEENKLEEEQKFIMQKSQVTGIATEKKALEERRWEIDEKIKESEKGRWEIEAEIKNIDAKIAQIDKSSEAIMQEKNEFEQKIFGIDKSLREIYSNIIERVEDQRAKKIEEIEKAKGTIAEARLREKEQIQRQQWNKQAAPLPIPKKRQAFADNIVAPGGSVPMAPIRKKTINVSQEEEQRKKFLQDIESWAEKKDNIPKKK